MKKYILIALVFIGTTVAAQNTNQPKLETKEHLLLLLIFMTMVLYNKKELSTKTGP